MRILWNRVAALVLTLALVPLTILTYESMFGFLSTIAKVGSSFASPEEQTTGLMAFGLVVLLILGIIRLLSRSGGRSS